MSSINVHFAVGSRIPETPLFRPRRCYRCERQVWLSPLMLDSWAVVCSACFRLLAEAAAKETDVKIDLVVEG